MIDIEVENEFLENFTSIHTRKSYKNDINKFIEYLIETKNKIKKLHKIERRDIVTYRNWLLETGSKTGGPSAPKTIARKLAALSSLFDYLVEKNLCKFNPVTSVKRPRREVKTATNALSRKQVREIFNEIEKNKNSKFLHKALLVTFFTTGLRKSEILNLKYKDYREINDYKVIEYVGKGGKIGQKLVHPMCVEAIDDYIEWMNSIERKHEIEDWLFQPTRNYYDPTNLNKSLNPKTINEIINFYAKKIGLNFKISPHSARATFISELLDQGVDIYAVAREVNHSSVTTTQEYDKRRKKIKDSPISKLKY